MPERPANALPIPVTMLGELNANWFFTVRCAVCRSSVKLPVSVLIERAGPRTKVWSMVQRLRCGQFRRPTGPEKCNGRPCHVTLVETRMRSHSATVVREIIVLDTIDARFLK